jgi:glutamine amidotransferase-like protein
MTVDSEAIFALVDERPGRPAVLEELRGALAAAWLDEREPDALQLARGVGRPLWIGRGRHELVFASTPAALELAGRALRLRLRAEEVAEGRLVTVVAGRVTSRRRFRPDLGYREENVLPSVRAPQEGERCRARLRTLAALPS